MIFEDRLDLGWPILSGFIRKGGVSFAVASPERSRRTVLLHQLRPPLEAKSGRSAIPHPLSKNDKGWATRSLAIAQFRYTPTMPTGLRRYQQSGHRHAINVNCFRKRSILDTAEARDTFLKIFEETRKDRFEVVGYVVMPTHVHIVVSEPGGHKLSTAMQVLKQRFSCTPRIETEVWEPRYYDFNELVEKLRYIHDNPINAGLAATYADWPWSSYKSL